MIQYGQMYFMAFGAALIVVAFLGVSLQFERLFGDRLLMAIPMCVSAAIALAAIASNRDLRNVAVEIDSASGEGVSAVGSWGLRVITLIVLGLSTGKVLSSWFGKDKENAASGAIHGKLLLVLFLSYAVSVGVLGATLSAHPMFSLAALYCVPVFWAAYAARNEPLGPLLGSTKWALTLFMALSLGLAFVNPGMVFQFDYKSWIPGLNMRLWGVGSNPNSVGPMALLLVYLEIMSPASRRWLRGAVLLLGFACLVLSQSKTAWVAGVIGASVLGWYRYGRLPGGGIRIGYFLFLLGICVGAIGLLAFVDLSRLMERVFASQAGSEMTSLSGRSAIWQAAINAWLVDPIFGYGPSAWGPLHRMTIAMPFAFSAHNQFLHTLSVAGALGGVSVLVYFFWMAITAIRMSEVTQGGALALFLLIGIRSITETPLAISTLFNGEMLMHWCLFAILVKYRKPSQQKKAPYRPLAPIAASMTSPSSPVTRAC